MKVKFIFGKQYDAWGIWCMLSHEGPAGIEYRSKAMGVSPKQAKPFKNKEWADVEHLAIRMVEDRYSKILPFMKKSAKLYQSAWDEINDEFSRLIEKKTNQKWKFKEYFVVVSAFHHGLSNRRANKVCRIWNENPYVQRRITAHEILMTHIWNILDARKHPLTESQAWALNEITTTAILGLEKDLMRLWPWSPSYDKYLSNYPQIWKLRDELKPLWVKRKSFEDYLEKAIVRASKLKC